ncbi:unnamed protein product [Brassicogethes aeneus]|uniref:Uncharacterized protein n=1 Tax=Brassicogethes aeneus TaxID=1431903 RepID=A0A9P0FIF9_BRAAE|nr:unnamed protein product [Brassicogethes aeneus]
MAVLSSVLKPATVSTCKKMFTPRRTSILSLNNPILKIPKVPLHPAIFRSSKENIHSRLLMDRSTMSNTLLMKMDSNPKENIYPPHHHPPKD